MNSCLNLLGTWEGMLAGGGHSQNLFILTKLLDALGAWTSSQRPVFDLWMVCQMLYCSPFFFFCQVKNPRLLVTSDHAVIFCNSSWWSPSQGINEAMHSWSYGGPAGSTWRTPLPISTMSPCCSLMVFSSLPIKIVFQALGWNFDSRPSWGHLETSLQKLNESHIRFIQKSCSQAGEGEGLKGGEEQRHLEHWRQAEQRMLCLRRKDVTPSLSTVVCWGKTLFSPSY